MKLERKTIIYLIIAAIVVFIFVMALISKYFPKSQNPVVGATISSTQTGTITNISDALKTKVFFPGLSSSGFIDFLGDKGIIFYRYIPSPDQKNKIWDNEVLGTYNAVYSPDGNYAIVKSNYPEQKNIYFDFLNKKSNDINSNIMDTVWTKDNKIIYNFVDNTASINNISVSNPDGTSWSEIIKTDLHKPKLAISPDNKYLLLNPTIEDAGANFIYILDINSKNLNKLTDGGYESDPIWNTDGSKILYSQSSVNSSLQNLWVMDQDGQNKKDLRIKTTTGKSVWQDNENIIIAVPANITENSMSDQTFISQDQFYIVNTGTGKATKISIPNQDYIENVHNLMYDSNSKVLYFTSNDALYKLIVQ